MLAGVRAVELLDSHLHSRQGGDSRLQACLRIPQLLDVAPTAPAPSACVSMEASAAHEQSPILELRSIPAALAQHSQQEADAVGELSVWPVLAPRTPAHITTRCKVESNANADVPWGIKLTVPAYIAVVTPSLLKRVTRICALHSQVTAAVKPPKQQFSETDYGPWSSMFPAPSQSQCQTKHNVNFGVRPLPLSPPL